MTVAILVTGGHRAGALRQFVSVILVREDTNQC